MNSLLLHEQYVCDHPEDRTAARALVDHYEEVMSVPRCVAIKYVARLRIANRNARELAEAAALLAEGSPVREQMQSTIVLAADVGRRLAFQIILLPGSRPPTRNHPRYFSSRRYWDDILITVGARWVIRRRARILTFFRPRPSRRRWKVSRSLLA